MSKTPWHAALFVLAIFLLLPAASNAQAEKPSTQNNAVQKRTKAAKAPAKLDLQSVTLVSTEAAARKVAEEASARAQEPKAALQTPKQAASQQGAEGAVHEFHPEDDPAINSAAATFHVKDHKKSLLKNIHGSAYGAAASQIGQASGEAGNVGADSGNGKFHVYMEGGHSHTNTPVPH